MAQNTALTTKTSYKTVVRINYTEQKYCIIMPCAYTTFYRGWNLIIYAAFLSGCFLCACFILSIIMAVLKSDDKNITRLLPTARRTATLTTDLRTTTDTSSTQQQPTSSTTSPGDTTQSRDQTDETTFTDAQFSSGLAPPSYTTASDYKTVEV